MKNEELITGRITPNFIDTGRMFNGLVATRNFIELAIFVLFPYGVLLLTHFTWVFQRTHVTVYTLSLFLFGSIFVLGINGDSVLEFLKYYKVYKKNRRIARYNPRIKEKEEISLDYLNYLDSELPRDKIINFFKNFRNSSSASASGAISTEIFDPIRQEFFDDDMGHIETPDELKTKKELKAEKRQRKLEAKLKAKEEKNNGRTE